MVTTGASRLADAITSFALSFFAWTYPSEQTEHAGCVEYDARHVRSGQEHIQPIDGHRDMFEGDKRAA